MLLFSSEGFNHVLW